MNKPIRANIVIELVDGINQSDADCVADHQEIVTAILSGHDKHHILNMPEVDRWPMTYSWLKDQDF